MARATRSAAIALWSGTLLLAASPALAQEKGNTRMFVEYGRFWVPDDLEFATGGLRICSVAPLQPTVDWSLTLGLVPAIIGTMDLDLAVPVPIGSTAQVAPRAGLSGFGVLGGDVGGAVLGWNYGAGLVLYPHSPLSVRADYTVRGFMDPEGSGAALHTLSVGLGWRF